MALTEKQRRFVQALQRGVTKTRAAIEAGYSEKTAWVAGSRLAKHPAVVAAMKGDAPPPSTKGLVRSPRPAKPKPPPTDGDQAGTDGQPECDKVPAVEDPLEFLRALLRNPLADMRMRHDAAKALLPYTHKKLDEQGKKGQRAAAAQTASTGRFASAAPPRLVASAKRA